MTLYAIVKRDHALCALFSISEHINGKWNLVDTSYLGDGFAVKLVSRPGLGRRPHVWIAKPIVNRCLPRH